MRWLVTGAGGLLGAAVVAALRRARPDDSVTGVDRAALDITDPDAVRAAVPGHDVVINCAAWTDVDAAEDGTRGLAGAMTVNATGPGVLARVCRSGAVRLLHVSTDYVFGADPADTTGRQPFSEDHPPRPGTVYGASKLAGEWAVLTCGGHVVRTGWLHDGARGRTFVAAVHAAGRQGRAVRVVDDQTGQPTWVRPVADRLVALGGYAGPLPMIVHATCTGQCTRHQLARRIYQLSGADPDLVEPVSTAAFSPARAATRPVFSVLADTRTAALGLPPMPGWQSALQVAMQSAAQASPRPNTAG